LLLAVCLILWSVRREKESRVQQLLLREWRVATVKGQGKREDPTIFAGRQKSKN
jgi:hypothetical protein